MPYGGQGIDITLPAAADLSSYQYRFMVVDANGRGTLSTSCLAVPLGILQNKPGTADAAARIRISGVSKLVFGAATNEAALLASGPEGCGTATTTAGDGVGAVCLHAVGGSADIQDVVLNQFRY
jgi:hypothetical protein